MDTAKVFWSGRSQAVRLPRAYLVDAGEVRIRRRGRTIVLEPVPESWEWLDALAGEVDEDFVSARVDALHFSVLEFDEKDARQAGQVRAHLASNTLVTHNSTEFQRVPSLKVEDWKGSTPQRGGK